MRARRAPAQGMCALMPPHGGSQVFRAVRSSRALKHAPGAILIALFCLASLPVDAAALDNAGVLVGSPLQSRRGLSGDAATCGSSAASGCDGGFSLSPSSSFY